MRERLASMIGQDAYKVAIHTFHSFGSEVLNQYRYLTPGYHDAKPIDTIESSKILDDLLERLPWDSPYKPWFRASDTIREVASTIDNLKKWGITPDDFDIIIKRNTSSIEVINPFIANYWEKIDALWQKKDEKSKKIEYFKEFTDKVQQLNDLWWYKLTTSYVKCVQDSLSEAWETYEWDGSTKFMNAWRDTWTIKNLKNWRELKETSKLEKQQVLSHLYREYQKALSERGLIDFSDMILEALSLIESNDIVRMSLAERYQFILIDEFQDTNEAQMQIIYNILSVNPEEPNVFAVGDDDQSIYKFQWANTKNIRSFHDEFRDTKLIILEENYRTKEEIIVSNRTFIKSELSNISNIFPWAEKKFLATRWAWWVLQKKIFENELEEASWIIDDIEEKIQNGIQPHEIAVIAKKNKTLELLSKWLLEKKIPVVLSKEESIYEDEAVIFLIEMLRIIASLDGSYDEEDKELLVGILSHPCFEINRLTLWEVSKEIYHARKSTTKSWIEQLSNHNDKKIRNFANFVKELSQRSRIERLENIIDSITSWDTIFLPDEYENRDIQSEDQLLLFSNSDNSEYKLPFFNYYFGQLSIDKYTNIKYARHLSNLRKFIEWIRLYKNNKPFLLLSDAIEFLALIEKYNIDMTESHLIWDEKSSVELITVYKAKWLEWEYVYVPFLTESEYKTGKIWWSPLPKNLPLEAERDNDEDIERLVYTAATRAKDSLTLSYSKNNMSEKPQNPLSLLEIDSSEWEEITTVPLTSLTKNLEIEKKELFSLPYLWNEKDFLRDRIEKIFVMNATALQNFLNIVDAGPEYFVSNSLLRFPQAKNISASYGSAIHKALEDFFQDFTKNNSYNKSLLLDSFEKSFREEWFDRKTEEDYLARGVANLSELYEEIKKSTYGELFLEYDFRMAHGGTYLGDIQLTGKIDRIERKTDDSLIITDYKTGHGFDTFNWKWAEYEKLKQWKYRLQLCFYAVLFELSPRWRMFEKKSFELFFVEKNRDEDRFHRVIEYIQQGEVERTKKLIIAVMTKIQTLDFPNISKYPQTVDWIRMFEEDLLNWQI